jgi:hypothetical protein
MGLQGLRVFQVLLDLQVQRVTKVIRETRDHNVFKV